MKFAVIKPISVILTVIGIAGSVLAQDRVNPKVKKIVFEGSKVFSTFPFEKFATKVGKTQIIEVDGIKTTVTTKLLRKPVFVNTETCDPNGVPHVDGGFFFRVTKFLSYAVAGQVFAYDVDYELFDVRSGQEVGATTGGIYVASNKKGRYSQQCPPDFKLDYIPKWAKKHVK